MKEGTGTTGDYGSGWPVFFGQKWRKLYSNPKATSVMRASWALLLLWVTLNIVDIVISLLATEAGAIEVGLLYQVTGTWLATSINKMLLAILIGVMLVYYRKNSWLSLLNLGMLGLCIYNGYVLFWQLL